MLDIKTLVNSIGIVLTLIGVYIVYINSPINEYIIDGGSPDTDFEEIARLTVKRNQRMKYGVFAVIAGSILQLISNYLPAETQSC